MGLLSLRSSMNQSLIITLFLFMSLYTYFIGSICLENPEKYRGHYQQLFFPDQTVMPNILEITYLYDHLCICP